MNEAEFSEYVELRWSKLVRSAVLLGCNPVDAEDLVQATLERCFVRWERVRGADDRDAYVHRVLIRTLTASRARRWNGERPTEHLPDRPTVDPADAFEDIEAFQKALAALPVDQRVAVVLRYFVQMPEQQMSKVLGVPPGTVKSRLSRGLSRLSRDPSLIALRGIQ